MVNIKSKGIPESKFHMDEVIFIIWATVISALTVLRCQYGIEITDEEHVQKSVGVVWSLLRLAVR